MIIPISCEGEHLATPILGTLELPDDVTPAVMAAAQAGHLCEDCGYAYTVLTGQYQQGLPGLPPRGRVTAAMVDNALLTHGKGRKKPR